MSTNCNTVWSNGPSLGAFPVFLYSMVWLRVERVLQVSTLRQFQFHFKIHIARSGVRIPVKTILCDVTPMTTHNNQSIKLLKKFSIDWPLQKVERERKNRKNGLDWDSNPRPGNVGFEGGIGTATVCWTAAYTRHAVKPCCRGKQGKRPMTAHCFTQCSSGCPLDSLLFPVNRFMARGVVNK